MTPIPSLSQNSRVISTKDLIIHNLSSSNPLTAKQLYNVVKKESSKPISYQAVHKTINQLLAENVIERSNNTYTINKNWAEQLSKYADRLKESNNKFSRTELEEKGFVKLQFSSVIEFGAFVVFEFLRLPNPENKTAIAIGKRMFMALGIDKDEYKLIQQIFAKTPAYAISKTDKPLDRFFKKAIEDLGLKVKLGFDYVGVADIFVWGDYVLESYHTAEFEKTWESIWNSATSIDNIQMKKLQNTFYHENYPLEIVLFKSKEIADTIRNFTLPQCKEGSK